jgi:hypothetical protein
MSLGLELGKVKGLVTAMVRGKEMLWDLQLGLEKR